jgi:hypothetical protein
MFGVSVMALGPAVRDRRAAAARLGGAEIAYEHRKVGLDPCDAGLKACLAQPTQLLRSRARFVVFLIDGCHSVVRIFGDDNITDDDASAGHNDARDATKQISLARPIEVVDRQRGDHQIERSLRKGIFESSRAQVRGGKCSTGVVEHGRAFVDAHQLCAWVLSQHSLRRDSRSHTQVQNRARTQAARHLGHDILEAVVGGHLAPHELEIRLRMEVKLVAHAFPTVPRRSRPRSAVRCAWRRSADGVRCARSVRRSSADRQFGAAVRVPEMAGGGSHAAGGDGSTVPRVRYGVVLDTWPVQVLSCAQLIPPHLNRALGASAR